MPYVCDIRGDSKLSVIEVNGKIFIDGQEYTLSNLSPVAFSRGPAATPPNISSGYGRSPAQQLSLPRIYSRGYTGIIPYTGTDGEAYDSTRTACGKNVLGPVVYSSSYKRYYCWGNYTSANSGISSFDESFRAIDTGLGTIGGTYNPYGFFLPPQNGRWLSVVPHGNGIGATQATGWTAPGVASLLESGVVANQTHGAWWYQACLPYIESDWVFVVFSPWQNGFDAATGYNNVNISYYSRNSPATNGSVGATTWIDVPSTAIPGSSYNFSTLGCSPTNHIRVSSNEIYFYFPILGNNNETTTGLPNFKMAIGTISNLNSTPTRSAFSTAYTISSVDTTADTITTSTDLPDLSVVRFAATGTGAAVPVPLETGRDYWTKRQSANISKIATTYQNAVDGYFVDLTGAGGGTRTATAFEFLTLDTNSISSGGSQVTPRTTAVSGTIVRPWVFSNNGINYLCMGVCEPGARASLNSDAMNLYLWRLDNKRQATFLQKISAGSAGRVRSFFTLDEQQKRIAIIYDDRIMFYQWNATTNWTFQSTQDIQVQDVGVDSLGRVWVTSRGTYAGPMGGTVPAAQQLYVFEPSGAAANITLTFAQNAYTYEGAVLNSNIIVNAYDTTGARVAIGVTITRDTSNFSFAGGATSTTTVTSTTADTLVPISIFSTGMLSALAVPST